MNYLIKTSILCLLLTSNLEVFGQNSIPDTLQLTIPGKHKAYIQPAAYLVTLTFEEDPSKCDPATGYSPIEEKLQHFKEATKVKNIDWRNMAMIKVFSQQGNIRKKSFEYLTDDFDKIITVTDICRNQVIKHTKVTYIYSELSSDDIAEMGGKAIEDAQKKAEAVAKQYGKKQVKLMSIVYKKDGLNFWNTRSNYNYDFDRVPKYSTRSSTNTYQQLTKDSNQFLVIKNSKVDYSLNVVLVEFKIY